MTSPSGARAAAQPCKLFVGGLSAQTSTEALRMHFQKYGRLVDAVVMSKNGRPRGFGFVTFESNAGAAAALAEPQWLDGRMVDVKRAVPGEHTQERPSNKIFVGGLPQDADTEDLRMCFVKYGPVADAVVMVDRRTKRSRGFGFVRFANGAQGAAAAEAVLADAANHRMGGKWIEVKRATPAALLRDGSVAVKDVSPCSSGKTSSTATPAEQEQQQQQQQAYLAWELASKMGGFDCGWGMPGAAALGMMPGQGTRRTRRSRRRAGSGDAGTLGAELGFPAVAGGGGEAALYAAMAAGLWGMSSDAIAGSAQMDPSEWLQAAGVDPAVLAAWAGVDPTALCSELAAAQAEAALAEEGDELEGGDPFEDGSPAPPPGLEVFGDLSPMKVRCGPSNSESTSCSDLAVEDFLATEIRPWLSAC